MKPVKNVSETLHRQREEVNNPGGWRDMTRTSVGEFC